MRWSRYLSAVCLVVVAFVHLHLYAVSYHFIPTIGPLFILAGVLAILGAVAVLVRPSRMVGLAGAVFCLGTLVAYVLALLLPNGIFGFHEPYLISGSQVAYEGVIVMLAEVVGAVALGVVARGSSRTI
jgi:hypothetical protein